MSTYNIPYLVEALQEKPLQFDFELNPEYLPATTITREIQGYTFPLIGELTVLEKWFFDYLDGLYLSRAAAETPKMQALVAKFIEAHPHRFKEESDGEEESDREYETVAELIFSGKKDAELEQFWAENLETLQEIGTGFLRTTGEQLARISFFIASRVNPEFNVKKLGYMSQEKLALLSAGVEDIIRLEEGKPAEEEAAAAESGKKGKRVKKSISKQRGSTPPQST